MTIYNTIHVQLLSICSFRRNQLRSINKSISSARLARKSVFSSQKLIVTDETLYRHKTYPVPMHYREKVDAEMERMLKVGIIERSDSPHIDPIVPVIRKNGSIRVCLDARELNKRLPGRPRRTCRGRRGLKKVWGC